MSSDYYPDCWVVLEFTSSTSKKFRKVLAGWSGSYAYGSSWKLNSGIVETIETENEYIFVGHTGSRYHCNKQSEGMRMSISGVYEDIVAECERANIELEIIEMDGENNGVSNSIKRS